MVMKERDDELALFLEMRRREKEKSNLLLVHNSEDINSNSAIAPNNGGSPISKILSSVPTRKTAADNFLNSENDKSDYDWLLTPPGTPLFPSLEMESQKPKMSHIGISNARPAALKTRLLNLQEDSASRSNIASKDLTVPSGLNSSGTGNRRPSSSGGRTSTTRSATPTGRPTLTTTAKLSRPSTPTSRAILPSCKPAAPAVRSSTPTLRSSTPTVRSSTPNRSTARPSTPAVRASVAAPKPAPRSETPTSRSTSRSATPTRRQSAPSSAPSVSGPPVRSSSVSKSGLTTSKNPAASRGTSPTVKSRPWKPSEMPGFSLDAPPNLKTSLPERPASASRGRPGAQSNQLSSMEANSNVRRRQQSCSPSRVRTSNVSGSSIPFMRKANASSGDDVNPVLMGTKMVERVVNMRKLAPPKKDNNGSSHGNSAGKPLSSLDSSGFGRSLSKKSLDMALRHMDIRRSIQGNLRPLMTNIPASSMYSVRSSSTKSTTISVSDSPLATRSNASSEPSVNNNYFCLDDIEMECSNDFGSETGNASPTSQRGR